MPAISVQSVIGRRLTLRSSAYPACFGLVVQNSIQKRIMDFYFSVVADEPEFAEFVHEKTDAGSGGADHLCQCLLADTWIDRLRAAFLSEMREQKEKASRFSLELNN